MMTSDAVGGRAKQRPTQGKKEKDEEETEGHEPVR